MRLSLSNLKQTIFEFRPIVAGFLSDPSAVQDIEKDRLFYIDEDATSDQTLLKAGLTKAKAIITTLDSDAKNLYVTLTARQLAPQVTVVGRKTDLESVKAIL